MGREVVQGVAGYYRQGEIQRVHGAPVHGAPVDGADSGTCAAGEGDGTHREAGSAGCAWAQTATDATEAASTVCARALSASAGVDAWQHQPALETIWRLCTLRCALIHFQL